MLSGEEAVLGEGDPTYVLLIGTGLAFGAAISGAMQNVLIAKLRWKSRIMSNIWGMCKISRCKR